MRKVNRLMKMTRKDKKSNDTNKETTSRAITSQTKYRGKDSPLENRRPKKVYQSKVTSRPDLKSVSEILGRGDAEL